MKWLYRSRAAPDAQPYVLIGSLHCQDLKEEVEVLHGRLFD